MGYADQGNYDDAGEQMKIEIDLPARCDDCVFVSELCYCNLLRGKPIYQNTIEEYEPDRRAKFCPFDSKEYWDELDESVRNIET